MTRHHGPRTGRPPTRTTRGMISSAHYLATTSGLQVLQEGGSAVDAAIAAGAVLSVVLPHLNGIGGDGFWLIYDPSGGRVEGLNASGPAARRASRPFYEERGHGDAIPPRGAMAALTVPGVVDGWREAHDRFGTLPWERLFDDAIHHAAAGFAVSRSLADAVVRNNAIFSRHHSVARFFTPRGHRLREGERLVQEELARSLERIAHDGPRILYDGDVGRRVCEALEPLESPLDPADLRNFRAEWVQPLSSTYRGFMVYELPPNTQGITALQLLKLIEGFDLSRWGDGTAAYYHHMTESVKLVVSDRDCWLADPVFVDIPSAELLAESYLNQRRTRIRAKRAMSGDEARPGLPFEETARRGASPGPGAGGVGGSSGRSPGRSGAGSGGRDDAPEGGDTCSLVVVDSEGLAVSMIQSLHSDFGCGEVAADTGILLQNRGASFSLDPGAANRLEPGKRPAHTLIPGLLMKGKKPWLVFGTMGGRGQPQLHAALVTRLVDFGYDVQQAIEAPRWLFGSRPGSAPDLALESRVSDEVSRELARRGHAVRMLGAWDGAVGNAHAIRVNRMEGFLEGGADPRGDGAALGY